MRILHTSDWHLGASLRGASRAPEQARFLDWLVELCAEREVDALVVAGDVFDAHDPPAEALRLYYGFLGRLRDTGVRDVVVVAGNHDSPSRVEAPGPVLEPLGVHVVGRLRAGDGLERALVPLRARGGDEPAAACLAVPYVHEYHLGIRTTAPDAAAVRAAFRQAFGGLYRALADLAAERLAGLPVVATGHLVLGREHGGDFPEPIHRVGLIDGLPPDVLDPRIDYAALGHIHRAYPPAPRAFYSGTPVAISFDEARHPRRVFLVELEGAEPAVEGVEVPTWRDLVVLEGSADEVLARLEGLRSPAPLAPLVRLVVHLDRPDPAFRRRWLDVLEAHVADPPPQVVEVREVLGAAGADEGDGGAGGPDPLAIGDRGVFELLCRHRGFEPDEALLAAWERLLASPDTGALAAEVLAEDAAAEVSP